MRNLTHFVVAPSIGTLFLRPQPLASSVGPKNPTGADARLARKRAHVRLGWKKWFAEHWVRMGDVPFHGYHWLSLAEWLSKIGWCGTIWVFLGILSTNKPIWDTESWMSISLQWIILYSYSKIIKINVGNPKDPHAGQFVHRLRGKAQIAMLEKFAHKVHTHSHRPYNPYTIRMMFCVYTKVLCTPSMHGCSA